MVVAIEKPRWLWQRLEVGVVRSSESIRFASDDVMIKSLAQDLAEEAGETLIARLNPYSDGPQRTSTLLKTSRLHRCSCLCSNKVCSLSTASLSFLCKTKTLCTYWHWFIYMVQLVHPFPGKIVCLQPSDQLGLYIDFWLWAVGHDMPRQEALAKTTFYPSQLFTPFPDLPIQAQQHKRLSDCQSKNSERILKTW